MLNYNPEQIKHGNRMRMQAEEKPATFATYNGEADVSTDEDLVQGNRYAGPGGQRALELMQDPVAQQKTKEWMHLFGQSNQGLQFNQGAMQQAAMGVRQ